MGGDDKACYDDLKFEYEQLVREKNKNFDMSYRIFGLMIPASFVVLGIVADQGVRLFNLAVMGLATVALWISYGIDRRLTFLNEIKNIRLRQIEEEINKNEGGIWIQRFSEPYKKICDTVELSEEFNEKWKSKIIKLEKDKGIIERFFINKQVHIYIRFYNVFFTLIWVLLLSEKKWGIVSKIFELY